MWLNTDYGKDTASAKLFQYVSGKIYIPSHGEWLIEQYPNRTVVHKEQQSSIYPIINGKRDCTMMLLDNLAYPQWVSIDCHAKLLVDIVCVVLNNTNISAENNSVQLQYYCKAKNSLLHSSHTCCQFCLFTGLSSVNTMCTVSHLGFMNVQEIKKIDYLLFAVNGQLSPLLSPNYFTHIVVSITYIKYFSNIYFKNSIFSLSNITGVNGLLVYKLKVNQTDSFTAFGNIHRCSNNKYISGIFIDNGNTDCTSDSSDESDYNFFKSLKGECSPLHYKGFEHDKCVHYTPPSEQIPAVSADVFKCHSGKEIKKKYLNDLTSDCGFHADDELIYMMLLKTGKYQNCKNQTHIPCITGHSRCFGADDICVYKLDVLNTLTPCRNGGHLQKCHNFTCNGKFKCPSSFCVPFAYVCDARWDCPNGNDENGTLQCGAPQKCFAMFQCKDSYICVHLRDICDSQLDCPHGDDELMCSLYEIPCPQLCNCLYFAVSCINTTATIPSLGFSSPYLSLFMKESPLVDPFVLKIWTEAIAFVLIKNDLSHFCNITSNHAHLKMLRINHNLLNTLNTSCFLNIRTLRSLHLAHNQINVIKEKAFDNLPSMKSLNLSGNELNQLKSNFFWKVKNLKLVSLILNNIHFVEGSIFSTTSILETDSYHLCCILPNETQCSIQIPWYASCSGLLPQKSMMVSLAVATAVILAANLLSLCFMVNSVKISKQKNEAVIFEVFSFFVNFTDMLCGIYLVLLLSYNLHYKDTFFLREKLWQSGNSCLIMFILSFLFNISSPTFLVWLSLSRLMVIFYPFDSRFKKFSFVKRCLLISFSLCTGTCIAVGLTYRSVYTEMPTNLCLALVDPTNSNVMIKVTTIVIVWSQFAAAIIIVVAYSLAVWKKNQKENISQANTKKRSSRSMIVQLLILTSSNIACWIPSGVIYFTSMLLETYPTDMVIWTTIVAMPINAMINPVVFTALFVRNLLDDRSSPPTNVACSP